MKPLTAPQIAGNWGTTLLPLNADDSIDWTGLEEQVARLLEAGVNGIYTNGTTCEFWSQTEEEFDRLCAIVASRCERVQRPFQLGACHATPQLTLERIRRAREHNPGAIQVTLPDWWAPDIEEACAALSRFAEAASPIGLVLYNPPHAKRLLSPREFGILKQRIPEIVGVKVGGGDTEWYSAMRAEMKGLSVFIPGHHLATGLKGGAHGSYSNVACLEPRGAQRWFEGMRAALDHGFNLERRIQHFMTRCIVPFRDQRGFGNFALDKLLAVIGDWAPVSTRVRWPYKSIPMSEATELRRVARAELPELFENV